jgi:N-acetylneuraminic acid mutarotase
MKWVLVDKFDNIAHTVDLNAEYTDKEAQRYFVNLKQISYENFTQLWKVMTETEYKRLEVHNETIKEYEEFGSWLDVEKS